jgi:broad specificity phosphatase PhoE
MDFGAWEGLTRDEVAARDPGRFATWRDEPHTVEIPGGERLTAVSMRVATWLDTAKATHVDETIVLVTHAIPIRLIVLAALGLPAERLWSVDASPAGITEIEVGREWTTVHRMNTVAHLVSLA